MSRFHVHDAEAGRMKRVPEIGKRHQADVMQRDRLGFAQRTRIVMKEAAAAEAHARSHRHDIGRRQDQRPAWLQHATQLAHVGVTILQVFDSLDGEDRVER